ncbi:MAG: peptidoglycan endopeptidase [Firmicutes bacterium HGW-Firmicutes-15]|nr:MAG: peptidoglycan endopeptidase [Firmicutes bacterium HGW-Firmicutes-15]
MRGRGRMRRISFVWFLMAFMLMFSGTSLASQSSYVVQSGDCLWNISNSTGVSVDTIKQINGLHSDNLSIGQILNLGGYSAPEVVQAPTGDSSTYTVVSGDNLWDISRKFGTSVQNIRALNGLTSDALNVGDVLKVNGTVVYNPPVSRAGGNVSGSRVVEKAAQYLGTPYRYGGSGPGGFDCSGFAKYVLGQFQVDLPRTAASQYGYGVTVAQGDLLPGDLVFFACSGSGIDHVGIYSGDSSFIHSSSPHSGGVIYSSLTNGYYANTYVGAKRVIR